MTAAVFTIMKYTGKDSAFGTPVSSIGLKRIDQAVPAVYGNPIIPGDDTTDVNTYTVYRPDEDDAIAYSYESIFKLKLDSPPANQLSNIRIFPKTAKPDDPNLPEIFIGCSQGFTRPTNSVSAVASNNIWDYTEEDPFLITVGGESGQDVDENADVINYNATAHDLGTGNLIYMNNERQIDIPIVEGNTYTIINQAITLLYIKIYDVNDVLVTDPDVVYSTIIGGETVTITASPTLLASYPDGFKYGSADDVNAGSTISWLDLTEDPIETVKYKVEVRYTSNRDRAFYLNDERRPRINLRENKLYEFTNISGDVAPIRFLNNDTSLIANKESEIIVDGITVRDGGTVNEVVTIDPKAVKIAGMQILSYQTGTQTDYGNGITNINTALVGNYNVNTVGAGTANPLAAGETDFIYLQVKVSGESTVGQLVPEISIEYDES